MVDGLGGRWTGTRWAATRWMLLGITLAITLGAVVGAPRAVYGETGRPAHPKQLDSPMTARAVGFALQYGAQQYGALRGASALRMARPVSSALPAAHERSASQDQWWARDKAKHLVFSALWTLSTQYVLVAKADWDEGDSLPASIASGAAVGLAKEVYDWQSPPAYHFSTKDLAADAAGIALAVGVILL